MTYLGNTPTTQSFISGTDYFNGTGAQTAFTLTRTVASVNDIEAVVNNVVQQPNDAYTISGTTITFTSAPSAGTSNVYVRYLSTTTQSISPSQGTVGWAQLNSDTQQDLGISFKNRIINGAMVIDQRNAGASVTISSAQFTLDRWRAEMSAGSKYTVQQNAGSVTPPAGFTNYLGVTSTSAYTLSSSDYFWASQKIEGFNAADLNWGSATNAKTVTMSFWVRSSLTGTFGGAVRNDAGNYNYIFSYTINAANTWEQKSITITGATSGTWLTTNGMGVEVDFSLGIGSTYGSGTAGAWTTTNYYAPTGNTSVVSTNGATFYLTGVQFEVGTQATTFDNRSYGTELSLCQRYCNRFDYANTGAVVTGYIDSATSARGAITFPTMRTSASVSASSGTHFKLDNGAGAYVGTGISFDGATPTSARMILNSSGMTANQGGIFLSVNNSAYILLTAEL
jgi:hypothetical protein